ncbi:hypothetical protein AA313_de0208053 [Arthrobotrys entomopaga]|nr:hypothetical protein AA313_de0208053 [Arthrobotrys entomopaga]
MLYSNPVFALLRIFLLTALFASFSNIHCYALSERFYKDYIDAQSLLRGGGIRASGFKERQLLPGIVHCTPGTNIENSQELLMCGINYNAVEPPDSTTTTALTSVEVLSTPPLTMTISAPSTQNPTKVSQSTRQDHLNPLSTKGDRGLRSFASTANPMITISPSPTFIKRSPQTSYVLSKDLIGPRPNHNQPQGNSSPGWFDENLACDILFAGSVHADMATASATMSMLYDPYVGAIFIGTLRSGSVGPWATSSTLELASPSPFPDGPSQIRNWAIGGYPVILKEFASICADIDIFEAGLSTTSDRYPSDIWPTTTPTPDFSIQGTFSGHVRYSSVGATWAANWGPYDMENHELPFTVSFTGVDGNHSYSITKEWTATEPIAQRDAMSMVITMAASGPSTMATFLAKWTHVQDWPATIPSRRGVEIGSGAYVPATHPSTHSLPITEGQITTVVALTTRTVKITSTQTNTAIPLFGRAVNSVTSAAKKPKASRFPLSLILWIFILALLLTICIISLGWRTVSSYVEKRRQTAKSPSEGSSDSTLTSQKFNIFSNLCGTRNVSGSQVIDPHLLNNLHNRSKYSFESIKLDD